MSEPVPFFSAQRIHEGFDALAAVRRVLDRHDPATGRGKRVPRGQ